MKGFKKFIQDLQDTLDEEKRIEKSKNIIKSRIERLKRMEKAKKELDNLKKELENIENAKNI